MRSETTPDSLREALSLAWRTRDQAYLIGNTAVGAVAVADGGRLFAGCNVEHRFRCHDIHAEVSAIAAMVAQGAQKLSGIVVVAHRERFTPCGGCMDWIFQFGGPDCFVAYQCEPDGPVTVLTAHELMPFYPR